uniref:Uncharacterized protein n=1 Tax=Rhizophora mucronata TaxID=61149 RepID=A0A2P2JTC7_RHIMU
MGFERTCFGVLRDLVLLLESRSARMGFWRCSCLCYLSDCGAFSPDRTLSLSRF